jgi:hypothetical protein
MKTTLPTSNTDAPMTRLAAIRLTVAVILGVFLHTGCAMWPAPTRSIHVGEAGPAGSCADFFAWLDKRVATAGGMDAGYARIQHYPYLRADRFIASFRDDLNGGDAFATWLDHMQAMDQSVRHCEIANLSNADLDSMESVDGRESLYRQVEECGNLLKKIDFLNAGSNGQLRRNVSVPDEYIPLRRVLGVYPITQVFVSQGVTRWHAEARERFSTEPSADRRSVRYVSAAQPDTRAAHRIIQTVERDALGIPVYASEDLPMLFQAYAPMWDIETQSDDDRIGTPIWGTDGRIDVDTKRPQTYTHLSFTRFGKAILTQLNYVIWFPSRPKGGALRNHA